MLGRTGRVQLGTNIIAAFARSPTAIAHAAWDLQLLSKGRFILGLGSQVKGHMERRFGVPWTAPAPKMREMVQALRAIWDVWQKGGTLAVQGKHYQLSFMPQAFSPGPMPYTPPPIYLAATKPHMCRVVGEVADGILLNPVNTVRYLRELVLPHIADGVAKAGRSPSSVTVIANVFFAAGKNKAELKEEKEALRRWVAFYSSPRTYAGVLALHGWQDVADRLYRTSVEGDTAALTHSLPDEVLEEMAIIGEYDEVGERIKRRFGGLVQQVIPFPLTLHPKNLELWRRLVRDLE